jgi:hypothetical protein
MRAGATVQQVGSHNPATGRSSRTTSDRDLPDADGLALVSLNGGFGEGNCL